MGFFDDFTHSIGGGFGEIFESIGKGGHELMEGGKDMLDSLGNLIPWTTIILVAGGAFVLMIMFK